MVTRKNLLWTVVVAAAMVTGLSSCLKNEATPPQPILTFAFINGSHSTTGMDIFINNVKAGTNFTIGQSGASIYAPGTTNLTFKKTGTEEVLVTSTDFYDTLTYHTHVVYGISPVRLYTIDESENFNSLSTEKSNVRLFHLSPDIAAVDLFVNNVKVISNVTSGNMLSNTAFTAVDAGTGVKVTVKAANKDSVIAENTNVRFDKGYPVTVYLTGLSLETGTLKPAVNALQYQ